MTTDVQSATVAYRGGSENVAALEVHDLTVSYQRKPVLWNVDLAVPRGKLVGILGPNGAGKSTLMKAISGLEPAAGGGIAFVGKDITAMAAHHRWSS